VIRCFKRLFKFEMWSVPNNWLSMMVFDELKNLQIADSV
jgi:hypothetical protein